MTGTSASMHIHLNIISCINHQMDGRLTENTSPLAKKTYIISFIYGISDLPLFELVRVRNFRLKWGWRIFELKTTSRSGNEKMKFEVMRVQNIRLKLAPPILSLTFSRLGRRLICSPRVKWDWNIAPPSSTLPPFRQLTESGEWNCL